MDDENIYLRKNLNDLYNHLKFLLDYTAKNLLENYHLQNIFHFGSAFNDYFSFTEFSTCLLQKFYGNFLRIKSLRMLLPGHKLPHIKVKVQN